MDKLTKLSTRKVIQHYQLPLECFSQLKESYEVYVPLVKTKTRNGYSYEFLDNVFSSQHKAQQFLSNNINSLFIKECVIIKYPLKINYPTDHVYVLLNNSEYPQVITNDVNEWIEHRDKLPGYYHSIGDINNPDDNIILVDIIYI